MLNALNEWIPEYMQRNEFHGTQPKVNIASIEGGWPWRGARTPDTCTIYMDVRTPPEVLPMDAYREVRGIIENLMKQHACLEGSSVDIYVSAPGTSIPDDHELITTIVQAHTEQLGQAPEFGNEIWYSDAAPYESLRHSHSKLRFRRAGSAPGAVASIPTRAKPSTSVTCWISSRFTSSAS